MGFRNCKDDFYHLFIAKSLNRVLPKIELILSGLVTPKQGGRLYERDENE